MTWCREALSNVGQTPALHHQLLINELESVTHGKTDRLMIFMPPNSAKTTYASVLFPAWFLAQKPNQHLITTSHNADYADDLSRQVMKFIKEFHETLDVNTINDSPQLWRTTNGCVTRAAGAGGSITGRRADLFIIDDPIKGRQDADSLVIRDHIWAWYRAEVLTRLNPGGRIILIQTRWHPDDLAGRLLDEMQNGGEQWRILNMPAIAETDDDVLDRKIGDPLWPERFPLPLLERMRASVGEREWSALYQQRPRSTEGALFKTGEIQILDIAPNLHGAIVAAGWDFAATKQIGTRDPDWTVRCLLARLPSGLFVVLNIFRDRGGPDDVSNWLLNISTQDRATAQQVKISIPEDPGQSSKLQVLAFTRLLSGFNVHSSREDNAKEVRATPVMAQCNGGNLAIVKAPWNRAFLDELNEFPGSKDDQVDALSRAFEIVGLGPRPMVISNDVLSFLGHR